MKAVYWALGIIATAGAGLAVSKGNAEAKSLASWSFKVEGADNFKATAAAIDIDIVARVLNSGEVPLKIRRLRLEAFHGDTFIGLVEQNTPMVVRANGSDIIKLPFSTNNKGILSAAFDIISKHKKEPLKVRLVGYAIVEIKTLFNWGVKKPIDQELNLSDFFKP